MDGLCLEPCAGISELVRHDSNTIQVRVVLVDLRVRISPPVSDGDSLEDHSRLWQKSNILDDLRCKGRDIVPCEGLSGDVEWTLFEGWPLLVKVREEVQEVISSLAS